jgi:hypothetical protein
MAFMSFDWEEYKKRLVGEPDWVDADDLTRLSIESFRAERSPIRRDTSTGSLRLTGPGISGHSGALDGVAEAMRNFQRLILATGLSATGHTSLRGQPPADVVSKTRLSLNGSPLPGSLVLQIMPAMSPADEIAPNGQAEFFNDQQTQLVDTAMIEAFKLLEDGRKLGSDADTAPFLASVQAHGARVASTLRDFSMSLVKFGFEPDLLWMQPRRPRLRTLLSTAELVHISEVIASRKLELEPTTLHGTLRTVSEIAAWQVEIAPAEIVKVDAKQIPVEEIARLRTGMLIAVEVDVTEESGPADEANPKYSAKSFTILSERQ